MRKMYFDRFYKVFSRAASLAGEGRGGDGTYEIRSGGALTFCLIRRVVLPVDYLSGYYVKLSNHAGVNMRELYVQQRELMSSAHVYSAGCEKG